MTPQHFFSDGRYLGSRQIPSNRVVVGLDILPQRSIHYFCTRCGRLWGQVVHEHPRTYHQCYQRLCRKCGDGRLGTLPYNILGYPTNVEEDWPEEALAREFLLTLDQESVE